MKAMRVATSFLAALLFSVPLFVAAQQFQGLSTTPKDNKVEGSNDQCLDEKTTIVDGKPVVTASKSVNYQVCVEKKCTRAMETANPPICKCGIVSFTDMAGDAVKQPVPNCYPDTRKKRAEGGGSNLALQAAAQDYLRDIQPGTVQGNQRLSQALQNLGVPQTEANTAVANDPNKAYELVQRLAGGDTAGAQQAATELKLNTDISSKISALEPKDLPGVLKGVVSDAQGQQLGVLTGQTFASPYSTGLTDLERAKQAISCIESSCGKYHLVGPPTRNGDRALGKYQVMGANVPSWTWRACGRAYTPYEFLADTQCQERVLETVYGGYVQSCGSYEAAASRWFSGRCAITNSNDG